MQAWIYNPLQRIASDSGMEGGREGGSTRVGEIRVGQKRVGIASVNDVKKDFL